MLDLEHPNNILKIESLPENSEENVIQVYYKAYHLTGYYTTYATVTHIDEDTDEIIETKEMEVQCHSMIFRFLLKTQEVYPIDMTAKILKMKKLFLVQK